MFLHSASVIRATTCIAIALICISSFALGALRLPDEEVQALRDIGKSLGKVWNFSADPRSKQYGWRTSLKDDTVNCNCNGSYANDTFCHVVTIALRNQSLAGTLPTTALLRLPYLRRFDVANNYLSGTIPSEWGSMAHLLNISMMGNRLTGSIPIEIGNISTLISFIVESNELSGVVPSELGNLKQLKKLVLRNCNLIGKLPNHLGTMTNIQTLDISFNQLTGELPSSFDNLKTISFMYLSNNKFIGPLCDWFFTEKKYIDLSYNNFTINGSSCSEESGKFVNLFKSSLESNNAGEVTCLGGLQCLDSSYSLHINCGGPATIIDGIQYASDDDPGAPSRFYNDKKFNWAFSSTGQFLDSKDKETYIMENTSILSIENPQLYMKARISPISLTYYAYCLVNGMYTVSLHFVEIMFTNAEDYRSLGRRIFDVYIQGKLVLRDFNIVDKANGSRRLVIEKFMNIAVTNKTLEIRLIWAGKGTQGIPYPGVYGPLISAISIVSDSRNGNSISAGLIIGMVVATMSIIFLVLGVLYWRGCLGEESTSKPESKGIDLQTGSFSLQHIKDATNNFDETNKIGEGGFGPVYKGVLLDGTAIAVKQLSSKSKQGDREFVNEIGMISSLQHPNLVKLFGCCIDGNQLLLIYEYMENNSLAHALFGHTKHQLNLDWPKRYNICVGIARGLAYLHEESRLKIVHRDIKAANVLLDKSLNPKISDFGLARLHEEDNTHISTRVAGTYGYIAPEYALHDYLTEKADVYSFGIVTLEIISGRNNITRQNDGYFLLLDWARILKVSGKLMELVDPRLGSNINKEQLTIMINVAL